jgi:sigma-B regulation protein RsbU (phosphoserine phosphatase)
LPLGVESGEVFEQYSFDDLRPGMILIAATDGLWEARRADGEQFGMQRVRQLLRDHASQDARRITAAIVEALAAFVGDQPAEDDVTFVVAKIAGDKPR